jgi:hypothetical protein
MKLSNAIKTLERAGWTVTAEEPRRSCFDGRMMTPSLHWARKAGNRHSIDFIRNGDGDEVATVRVCDLGDRDDLMADYHAGVYCDSLAQAIRTASRPDGGR